jgi:hypothetical protein
MRGFLCGAIQVGQGFIAADPQLPTDIAVFTRTMKAWKNPMMSFLCRLTLRSGPWGQAGDL